MSAQRQGHVDGDASPALRPLTLELPIGLRPPKLTSPALGLHTLGFGGASVRATTVVDAHDARLLRSGTELVLDHGRDGDLPVWHLTLPDWLGSATSVEAPAADVFGTEPPPELADLVTPLLRTGTVTEFARLSIKRTGWQLRSDEGRSMVLFTDDTVTLRRGTVALARYREVTLTPTGCGQEALDFLVTVLESAGATLLAEPVPLAVRMGAPATGMPDLPEPDPVDGDAPAVDLFSGLIRRHARELVRADRKVRAGKQKGATALRTAVTRLRCDVQAFREWLDEDLADKLDADLEWLADQAGEALHLSTLGHRLTQIAQDPSRRVLAGTVESLESVRRSARRSLEQALRQPRYRRLLDTLVQFARSPRLLLADHGDRAPMPEAHAWLAGRWKPDLKACTKALKGVDEADPEQVLQSWESVRQRAVSCLIDAHALSLIHADAGRRAERALKPIVRAAADVDELAHAAVTMRSIALRGASPDPAVVFALGEAAASASGQASRLVRESVMGTWRSARKKLSHAFDDC